LVKPVTLPPGRARLAAKFSPTGSDRETKTIGIVRVSARRALTERVLLARSTSGFELLATTWFKMINAFLDFKTHGWPARGWGRRGK